MTGRTSLIPFLLILLVVVAVIVGVSLQSHASEPTVAPVVGHRAPDFALDDTAGRAVQLASDRGRVVLLDFWATWCLPCRSEMPDISRLYAAHRNSLAVLAVDKQEPKSDVQDFSRHFRLTFHPLLDPTLGAWRRYRVGSVQPVSFWVDPKGTVRAIHFGPMNEKYMRQELQSLLST